MLSRSLSRSLLRSSTVSAAAVLARPAVVRMAPRVLAVPLTRSLRTLDFGGSKENVVERSDYPKAKVQQIFSKDTLCMLGYGTQGRGQALNIRDNGLNIIVCFFWGGGASFVILFGIFKANSQNTNKTTGWRAQGRQGLELGKGCG